MRRRRSESDGLTAATGAAAPVRLSRRPVRQPEPTVLLTVTHGTAQPRYGPGRTLRLYWV